MSEEMSEGTFKETSIEIFEEIYEETPQKPSGKSSGIQLRTILKLGAGTALLLCLLAVGSIYAVYHGYFLLNNPSRSAYPVRGVDVSHYQGEIDWEVLSSQGIQFAYIKATEGSSHTDEKFSENWEAAEKTGLSVGAYHFFSFDSPWESQLAHFTQVVTTFPGMLPPVVDFEFYGDKKINPPDVTSATEQLVSLLEGLEEAYGMRPVIYATEEAWELYLKGRFDQYPLWIRNVTGKPHTGDQEWLFWQYTNRERLEGYGGEEEFIDMNVFAGDLDQWERWLLDVSRSGR